MSGKDGLITFCIIHTRRLECTKRCVSSIERYTDVGYCIKLLVQGGFFNEKAENYFESLEKRKNIEVIKSTRNIGVSAGRNLLLQKAKNPLTAVLDNDVYFTEGWLNPALEILERNMDVGFVGFPRHKFNGRFENLGGRNLEVDKNILFVTTPKHTYNKEFIEVNDLCGVILLRQEAKKDLTFDPQFVMAFSDLDKGLQLLRSKWKKVVCLRSRVIHDQVKDSDYLDYNLLRVNYPEFSKSYAKFRKKWGLRLSWREHVKYKYIYPLILPSLYKTLKKVKGMLIHPHLSHWSKRKTS